MIFPILIAMIILLVLDHINDGGSFVFFAKIVDWYNSFGKPKISLAQKTEDCVYIEYKAGKKLYGLMFPIRKTLDWKSVVAMTKSGQPLVVTDEFVHFAGPFKDFHGTPLKPSHINSDYTKIAFVYAENDLLEVDANDVIIAKFKQRADQMKLKEVKTK